MTHVLLACSFRAHLISVIITSLIFFLSCRPAGDLTTGEPYPESLDKRAAGEEVMIATAHPLATDAGLKMLETGGTAADAAVAAGFVLAVVEPMMSGLGGSGSATIWDASEGRADYLDYYAQFGADPDFALDFDWEIDSDGVSQERLVAVPGTVAGFYELHKRYGVLAWKDVVGPAIELARYGFTVHRLLGEVIQSYPDRLNYDPEAAIIFYPGGRPLQAGERLIQGALANQLERIAEEGPSAFYNGPAAERAVKKIRRGGSTLSLDDFSNYRAQWKGAVAGTYRDLEIYSAPPPLAGEEVILGLNILEAYNLPDKGYPIENAEAASILADVFRVSMTDRWRWTGDPTYIETPVSGMISNAYSEHRRRVVGTVVPDSMIAGDPWPYIDRYEGPEGKGIFNPARPPQCPFDHGLERDEYKQIPEDYQHTTHLSVIDSDGNAISMTNTLGLYFGTGVFSEGVFYNSTNRNARLYYPNLRIPNRTAHSSTAPTIVVKNGEVRMAAGSAGSGRIPVNVISMILYTFDYGLDPAISVRMPRMFPEMNDPRLHLEGGYTVAPIEFLHARGYQINPRPTLDIYFGGVHMVYRTDTGSLIGVADPRRDGEAAGY